MPDLQFEREQLTLADTHIQAALAHIGAMRATIDASRGLGFDTSAAEAALVATTEGLRAFIEHRALIEATIRDIEEGRLPDAPRRHPGPPARP